MEDWTLTAARNVLKLARMGAPARSRLANTARREGRRATAAGLLHGVRAPRAARWAGCRGAGPAGAHRPAPAGRAGVPGWDGETGCPAERPGRPRAARPGAARCGNRSAGDGVSTARQPNPDRLYHPERSERRWGDIGQSREDHLRPEGAHASPEP